MGGSSCSLAAGLLGAAHLGTAFRALPSRTSPPLSLCRACLLAALPLLSSTKQQTRPSPRMPYECVCVCVYVCVCVCVCVLILYLSPIDITLSRQVCLLACCPKGGTGLHSSLSLDHNDDQTT